MKPPTSVFALGRMRHLDLLALWHELNPDGHEQNQQMAARMTTGHLAAAIHAHQHDPKAA